MCAIHGYCWQDEKLMGEMLCKAHHRGPDGQGTFFNDDISLGHNLLSITDIPNQSKQPWEYKDLVLVYNGEIYNHMQLRDTLDHKFQTDTDTETPTETAAETADMQRRANQEERKQARGKQK